MVALPKNRLPSLDFSPIRQASDSLAVVQAGLEDVALQLFDSLASLHAEVQREESEVREQRRQLAEQAAEIAAQRRQLESLRTATSQVTHDELATLHTQHEAISAELESLRREAAEMSQVIAEQQQRMSNERSEWSVELGQLRRILDKQAKWLEGKLETGSGLSASVGQRV